jgi:thiol-disulfide isomerase/thioredoxin
MKKTFVIIPLLMLCIQLLGQATEITFEHGTWTEILAKAKQDNKMVFMDANTSWCGPCKWMAAKTFTDPNIAALFNSHFVNVKMDMEKGEGPALRAKYGVNAFPTLIFVDGDGNMVHSQVGALNVEELTELANEVLDPKFNSLVNMAQQFEQGERDRTFLKDYLIRLSPEAEDFNRILEPFKPGMVGEGLLDPNSWTVFETCFENPHSEFAQYFLAHRRLFENKFGLDTVQQKAYQIYMALAASASGKGDLEAFTEAKRLAAGSGMVGADALAYKMQLNWYTSKQDVPNYVATCNKLFKTTVGAADIHELKFQSMIISRACDKKEDLESAMNWLQKVLEVEPDYIALQTLARLQFKLGRTPEGMATAEKAIAAAKAEDEEFEDVTKLIEKYGPAKK